MARENYGPTPAFRLGRSIRNKRIRKEKKGILEESYVEQKPVPTGDPSLDMAQDVLAGMGAFDKYDPQVHADKYREKGFEKEAQQIEKFNLDKQLATTRVKQAEQKVKLEQEYIQNEVQAQGFRRIRAGDKIAGLQMLNRYAPEGQKIKDVKSLGGDNFRVIHENGSVEVVDANKLDKAFNTTKTRLLEREKMSRLRVHLSSIEARSTDKSKAAKFPTQGEILAIDDIMGAIPEDRPMWSILGDEDKVRLFKNRVYIKAKELVGKYKGTLNLAQATAMAIKEEEKYIKVTKGEESWVEKVPYFGKYFGGDTGVYTPPGHESQKTKEEKKDKKVDYDFTK